MKKKITVPVLLILEQQVVKASIFYFIPIFHPFGVHESSLPVAHPGYQVLSDILFRLGLIANCSHTVQYLDCGDLN